MRELVAVVDLGSTAVRLLLARIAPGTGYRVLVEERVPTRLGGGAPGRLDNIRVISIVDRYLEHARIFHFENAGDAEYLLASADWMPRNLDRRIEIAFPVLDPRLQAQIRDVLLVQLADTVKARRILGDGRSVRIPAEGAAPLRSQERLYEAAAAGTS